jgi:hypothetical protein
MFYLPWRVFARPLALPAGTDPVLLGEGLASMRGKTDQLLKDLQSNRPSLGWVLDAIYILMVTLSVVGLLYDVYK